jgi:hypothetical protein
LELLAPYPICFSDRGVDVFVDLFDLDAGGVLVFDVSMVCFGGAFHLIIAFFPPIHNVTILVCVAFYMAWCTLGEK